MARSFSRLRFHPASCPGTILPFFTALVGVLKRFMAAITRVAIKALDQMGGPRIVLAAIPGGAKTVSEAAGVSASRVSQVLRRDPLPWEWAQLLAELAGCTVWEVYEQLGQRVTAADMPASQARSAPERSPCAASNSE